MKTTNDDMAGGGGVARNPHSVDRRSIPQDVLHAAVTLAFDAQQDAVITYDGQEYCAELEARRASQEDVIVFVIPKWTHRDFAPSEVGAGYVYDTGSDNWVLMKKGQPLSDEGLHAEIVAYIETMVKDIIAIQVADAHNTRHKGAEGGDE